MGRALSRGVGQDFAVCPQSSEIVAPCSAPAERTAEAMADGYYRTGDIGSLDAEGYLTYVGRSDDVFKSSDYKVSPFELESALLEHEAVVEAAVVPALDELRLAVPKAYVVLAKGWAPGEETAEAVDECWSKASAEEASPGSPGQGEAERMAWQAS